MREGPVRAGAAGGTPFCQGWGRSAWGSRRVVYCRLTFSPASQATMTKPTKRMMKKNAFLHDLKIAHRDVAASKSNGHEMLVRAAAHPSFQGAPARAVPNPHWWCLLRCRSRRTTRPSRRTRPTTPRATPRLSSSKVACVCSWMETHWSLMQRVPLRERAMHPTLPTFQRSRGETRCWSRGGEVGGRRSPAWLPRKLPCFAHRTV